MRILGVDNIFHDYHGNWATVSWDAIIERDPAVIVVVTASWDTAEDKFAKLAEPQFRNMTAVKTESWVTLDFSDTTPGITNVAVVELIANLIEWENLKEDPIGDESDESGTKVNNLEDNCHSHSHRHCGHHRRSLLLFLATPSQYNTSS